jgi:hypothetical protein
MAVTVKRNTMAQALARPQTVQRVWPVATTSQYSSPNAQLDFGQGLVNKAVSGQGFDPQGGWGVAAAQIATAGIGAWAQNRARKEIAEKEVASQQQFAIQYPQYADMASQLSPETRQAYTVAKLTNDLKAQDPSSQLNLQKTQAEINKLNAEASKAYKETKTAGAPSAPTGYRFQQDGNLEAIPGGPAGKLSAESAGKVALIKQGEMDVTRFRDLISKKDSQGNVTGYKNDKLAGLAIYGAPGARQEYSTLFNAINARLRLESGAAVPEAEVERALKTFAPNVTDSDKTIKSKIDRLDEFFGIAKQEIGQGRGAMPGNQTQSGFKILNVREK